MKRITFLLIVSALIFANENINAQRLTIAATGGLSIPGLTGTKSNNPFFDSNTIKTGGNIGLYGEYHATETFSYSLGLEYTAMGGLNRFKTISSSNLINNTYSFGTLYSNFESNMNLNYLSIPILARQSWTIGKTVSVYAGIGPVISILINASRAISSDSLYTNKEKTQTSIFTLQSILGPGSQTLNPVNFGVKGIVGLSYKINKKEAILVQVGAIYGLSPIQHNSINGSTSPFSEMISVGYAYTFKDRYKNRYRRGLRN